MRAWHNGRGLPSQDGIFAGYSRPPAALICESQDVANLRKTCRKCVIALAIAFNALCFLFGDCFTLTLLRSCHGDYSR